MRRLLTIIMIFVSLLIVGCDEKREDGDRIVSLRVGERPFDDQATYTVASAHTRFHLNPLFAATSVKKTDQRFVDVVMKFIETQSPIKSGLDRRIQATN